MQYNIQTLKEFIKDNSKGIFKVSSFNGAEIGSVFIIDGKLYKSAKPTFNINVMKSKKATLNSLPKHEIFTIIEGNKYFL